MEAIETYEHAGVQVKIMPDDSGCGDPRDADNPATLYCYHPSYELGDELLPSGGLEQIDCPEPNCEDGERTDLPSAAPDGRTLCPRCEGHGTVDPTVEEWLKDIGAIAAMPLFLYEHSGITMRTGSLIFLGEDEVTREDTDSRNRFAFDADGWDTSFVGFIVADEESLTKCCGDDAEYRTREWLEDMLRTEVEVYAMYLEGQVYGYIVGENTPFEDSCWGFLGFEHVKEEANDVAKIVAEETAKEANERADWAARDVMTLG